MLRHECSVDRRRPPAARVDRRAGAGRDRAARLRPEVRRRRDRDRPGRDAGPRRPHADAAPSTIPGKPGQMRRHRRARESGGTAPPRPWTSTITCRHPAGRRQDRVPHRGQAQATRSRPRTASVATWLEGQAMNVPQGVPVRGATGRRLRDARRRRVPREGRRPGGRRFVRRDRDAGRRRRVRDGRRDPAVVPRRLPGIARKFLGDEYTIRQEETWAHPDEGALDVTIPGASGVIGGVVSLAEDGGGDRPDLRPRHRRPHAAARPQGREAGRSGARQPAQAAEPRSATTGWPGSADSLLVGRARPDARRAASSSAGSRPRTTYTTIPSTTNGPNAISATSHCS